MEVKGKIIVALPEQAGVSKAGNNWKKKEYVLETQETYPKKIHFDFFGERADQYPLNVGDVITLSFDIDSREDHGRWFKLMQPHRWRNRQWLLLATWYHLHRQSLPMKVMIFHSN